MEHDKVEFRQRLDFGQLISHYFEFIKYNWKDFSNIFLRYNGIFMLLFLGISYMMVTGFMGMISSFNVYGGTSDSGFYTSMVFGGFLLFFILFLIVGGLNYGITSLYMSKYVNRTDATEPVDGKAIWTEIKARFGSVIIFLLLMILIFIGFSIVSVILAFIPLIGTLVSYVFQFAISAWLGVSFVAMFHENKSPSDAMGIGWNLVMDNFWKCVGVSFVLGFIITVYIFFLLSVPGIIAGLLYFHAVDTQGVEITDTIYTLIWTIFVAIFVFFAVYSQALSQFVNGALYFSTRETKTNQFLRSKIDQIGVRD